MFVALPGFIVSAGGGSFPPAGTLLSSTCSGFSAHDVGPETYIDAQGTAWYGGMYTLWEQLADGSGGSYWQSLGANASDALTYCWLPAGFCIDSTSNQINVEWNSCGGSGTYGPVGNTYSTTYADGAGGTYGDSGNNYWDPPSSGTVIYSSGVDNCCQVIYDGAGGYYVTDTCGGGYPSAGTVLYSGCAPTSGTDAAGSFFDGAWTYGDTVADGSGGSYFSAIGDNQSGCYYPYGWKYDYSANSYSLHWVVYDSSATTVAEGDTTYADGWSSSAVADGSGGTFSDSGGWSLTSGDSIASGIYYDSNYAQDWYYYVYYDGMGGFYTSQYPV